MASSMPTLLPRDFLLTTTTTGESPVVDIRETTVAGYFVNTWIGGGRLADVFQGTDRNGKYAALKARRISDPSPLEMESGVLQFLFQRRAPVPHTQPLITFQVAESNGYSSCHIIIMDYLCSTVETLRARGGIPNQDILYIAREAVFGIIYTHRLGIIHGGITGRSLAFKEDRLVFTDFGRACFIAHFEDISEEIQNTGTYLIEVTRRSDLKALALVLVSLMGINVPSLPRNPSAQQRVKFQDEVKGLDADALANQIPLSLNPLRIILNHVFTLEIEEKPDYNLLRVAFNRT